jgi:DNA end-binding protein Ku
MRATWTGLLKISLVTIPIKVYPATETEDALALHQLHGACGSRIQQKRWCPTCEKEIAFGDLVKGYEVTRGQYVVLTPADLEAVVVPSTKVIAITHFADATTLDPLYLDRPYYLAPDGHPAAAAFAVVAQALTHAVGIGTVALYGREYLVAVRSVTLSDGRATLLLHTLHHDAEVRAIDQVAELEAVPAVGKVDVDQVALARKLIAALCRPLDLATFTDAYRAGLQRIIDLKIAGAEIVTEPRQPVAATVNLREALTKSLAAVDRRKKTPAKASLKKRRAA